MSIIKVENLSKTYRINSQRQAVGNFREWLTQAARTPLNLTSKQHNKQLFWALRDLSFEIQAGETLGVVGKNGAGKSTLLKILSRITKPTSGSAELRGRVASLLEVGTGFHSELSGRENVFLNGAILGMQRDEIKQRFDEIISFAQAEQFVDTPVKFYSSGMFMRLAFAVAAHLTPEILIVDEVLAVGDIAFQNKCLDAMKDVAKAGRTVIFVSHSSAALQRLCKTGIYLEKGQLRLQDNINVILANYQADIDRERSTDLTIRSSPEAVKEGETRFINWRLVDSSTEQPHITFSRENCHFQFTLVCKQQLSGVCFRLTIQDMDERNIIVANSTAGGKSSTNLKSGIYEISWQFDLPIKDGEYKLIAEIFSSDETEALLEVWEPTRSLTVLPVLESDLPNDRQGMVNTQIKFESKKILSNA